MLFHPSFHSISNFYEKPDEIREHALSLSYPPLNLTNGSPGRTVNISHHPQSAYTREKIIEEFHKHGIRIQIINHSFRIASQNEPPLKHIHFDPIDFQLVISLSKHSSPLDANQYYKHDNGFDKVDKIRILCDNDYKGSIREMTFEKRYMKSIGEIRVEYNKAIFIESQYFHLASHSHFGNEKETSRLVEILSLNIMSYLLPKAPSSNYSPLVFYFQNAVPFTSCDECVEVFQHLVKLEKHAMFHLKHPIMTSFQKFANEYIKFISSSIPMLHHLLSTKQVVTSTTLFYEVMPENFVKKWDISSDISGASFKLIFILNDTEDVHQIYDSTLGLQAAFPNKKGSLIIYPNSWLFPFSQKISSNRQHQIVVQTSIIENKFL